MVDLSTESIAAIVILSLAVITGITLFGVTVSKRQQFFRYVKTHKVIVAFSIIIGLAIFAETTFILIMSLKKDSDGIVFNDNYKRHCAPDTHGNDWFGDPELSTD